MNKEPITVKGLKKLKDELDDLQNVQRPKVVAAIAEARSHGDLKENAEYHAAKEQQGLIEGRIIMFPGWLTHEVAQNMCDLKGEDGWRVSVSFNFAQRWKKLKF